MLILSFMHIGKNIFVLRKKAGLTQLQLAEALGVKQQMIADYERCKVNPEVAKLPALAQALDVEVGELFRKGEIQEGQAAKMKRKNSREVRAQEAFRNLKPEEQRVIISHMNALIRATRQKKQPA